MTPEDFARICVEAAHTQAEKDDQPKIRFDGAMQRFRLAEGWTGYARFTEEYGRMVMFVGQNLVVAELRRNPDPHGRTMVYSWRRPPSTKALMLWNLHS